MVPRVRSLNIPYPVFASNVQANGVCVVRTAVVRDEAFVFVPFAQYWSEHRITGAGGDRLASFTLPGVFFRRIVVPKVSRVRVRHEGSV